MGGAFLAPTASSANVARVFYFTPERVPIPGALVSIELNQSLCPGVVLTGVTNSQGVAEITVLGGDCRHTEQLSMIIRINGISVRYYANVKSPDFDGSSSNLRVDLADLVAFSEEFGGSAPSACHDYDNNGFTGLEDLILFAPAFIAGSECN